MSFFNPPSTFYSSPPPPPLIYVPEGTDTDYTSASSPPPHSSSSMNPSILIIILILVITFVASISLCLLLRHLNRRCISRLSSSTTTLTSAADSHSQVLSNRRVSPENPKNNFVDSLLSSPSPRSPAAIPPRLTAPSACRSSNRTISFVCCLCVVMLFTPNASILGSVRTRRVLFAGLRYLFRKRTSSNPQLPQLVPVVRVSVLRSEM
jgi:hypothetical protein